MNKRDLWNRWADPSDWGEYNGSRESLDEEEADFYKDLDKYYIERQREELEETKDKLLEHIEKLRENEETGMAEEKAWKMNPQDMQEQVQKQLKNLKSIKL